MVRSADTQIYSAVEGRMPLRAPPAPPPPRRHRRCADSPACLGRPSPPASPPPCLPPVAMSAGSGSEVDELPDMDLRALQLDYPPPAKRQPRGELYPSGDNSSAAEEEEEEEDEEEEDGEGSCAAGSAGSGCKRKRARGGCPGGKKAVSGQRGPPPEGKQSQRNAANARERARMRVLSKAFSRLKTSLPWVPPDTKLSKLDTLRLASSYIAHLRQLLQEDRYENGYVHPVNLTWPFVVSGRPDSDSKEVSTASRLCGTTA